MPTTRAGGQAPRAGLYRTWHLLQLGAWRSRRSSAVQPRCWRDPRCDRRPLELRCSSRTPQLRASPWLFGPVAGARPHLELTVDSGVADGGNHAEGGMDQHVAVEHPESGVVGVEGDFPMLTRPHEQAVDVDRTAVDGRVVAPEHGERVTVQVHRMKFVGPVVDDESDALSGPDRVVCSVR